MYAKKQIRIVLMHGKISFYNPKTKIGVIMDKNKRVYEFDKNGWHDRYNLPLQGMLVEFRSDDSIKVSSAKKSIFYTLSKKYGVSENYFWSSKDDPILLDQVQKELEELIIKKAKTINVEIPIPSSRSIDECFDVEYFEHMELVYKFEYATTKKYEELRLDYMLLKRFIKSAKENLVKLDGSILEDEFADYEAILTKCEHLLALLINDMNKEKNKIYEDVFLKNQIDYQGFLKWQELAKERIFQVDKVLKMSNSDNDRYLNVLKKEIPKEERMAYEERQKKVAHKIIELSREQKLLAQKLDKNKKRVAEFERNRYVEFFEEYDFIKEQKRLFGYLRDVMNHVAFLYNYEIYAKASNSANIHNTNSQDFVNIPYSAIALAHSFLKNINVDIASPKDKKLSEYIKRYIGHKMVFVAILSAEAQIASRIKNIVFKEDMIFYVEIAQKSSEALGILKSKKIDVLVFDPSIKIPNEELKILIEKNNKNMTLLYLGEADIDITNIKLLPMPIKESELKNEIKEAAKRIGRYLRDMIS